MRTAADAAIVETSQSGRRWKENFEKHGQAFRGTCSRSNLIDLKMQTSTHFTWESIIMLDARANMRSVEKPS
jgi:hypothetical protein